MILNLISIRSPLSPEFFTDYSGLCSAAPCRFWPSADGDTLREEREVWEGGRERNQKIPLPPSTGPWNPSKIFQIFDMS